MPRLGKAKKIEVPSNHAQANIQINLGIAPTKFFFLLNKHSVFPPYLKARFISRSVRKAHR